MLHLRECIWFLFSTLEAVHTLTVSGNVNRMCCGLQGVWISFRSSTKLCLYHPATYTKLLEVDYTTFSPSPTVISSTEVHSNIVANWDISYYNFCGRSITANHFVCRCLKNLTMQYYAISIWLLLANYELSENYHGP